MSWGERSCKRMTDGDCPVKNPEMHTCTVDCYAYESNGKQPDTKSNLNNLPQKARAVYLLLEKEINKVLKKDNGEYKLLFEENEDK
jgi:hypothetical protein